ncbi:toll/interleukin-1 receptor domain-containing protein [Candidatus Viridilinea mediisalina]|uniref:TIR domain-containing protein n=1 Tax=Candidatus Viridilinea mediisalina TaxID=2024553 RepID=A0A2A6REG2_9CHLR|nr:toll/interleukin-1 receptor domain-containing protein [Candidatus Viridilinea mediisalina]PDW00946.1 hypothetical protein CJ255_19990 [Candidatus Viridilinea mediisalina]
MTIQEHDFARVQVLQRPTVEYLPSPLPEEQPSQPTPMQAYPYDCFISYHAPDREVARWLTNQLRQAGLRPWFDQDEILTGQLWMERVEEGLTQARATLVLIGPHGVGRWQRQEAYVAIRQAMSAPDQRPVIPVLLPGGDRHGLPLLLDSFSWVDLSQGLDDPATFARLLAGLE